MARRRRSSGGPSGVLVVDKPAGPTSHDVVQHVRRVARESRVGHTGTLDPAATGVLVVCLGRAAKLVRFLQAGSKTYAARMVLGVTTDSQDADGHVVEEVDASHIDEATVCEALTRFQGHIEQVPPMVSALKVDGTRLHELARRGEEVEREPRAVRIDDLILDRYEPGVHPQVSFLVTCSAGTYVRTIAHDVGATLGVGGSLVALRRLANGPFGVDDAVTPEALDAAVDTDGRGGIGSVLLTPVDAVTRALPSVPVDDPQLVARLANGGRLPAQGLDSAYALVADGRLVGIYRDGDDGSARSELVWIRPEELA